MITHRIISRWFLKLIEFTWSSLGFHFEITSIPLRFHFWMSLRFQNQFNFELTSISLRFHFDFNSISLRFHFGFTSISHRLCMASIIRNVHPYKAQDGSSHIFPPWQCFQSLAPGNIWHLAHYTGFFYVSVPRQPAIQPAIQPPEDGAEVLPEELWPDTDDGF